MSQFKSHTAGRGQLGMVETEANGDSMRTNEGVLPWFVRRALRASTRDCCPAVNDLVCPVKVFNSLTYTVSIHLFPLPSKRAGSRAGSPGS